jgi:hypothetical protein
MFVVTTLLVKCKDVIRRDYAVVVSATALNALGDVVRMVRMVTAEH